VVVERTEEARAGRERSSERRRRCRAAERQLLRASERVGESTSRAARLAAGTEADAAGHSWWPTRARPSCRMLATRRPSSAGSPRRHSAAVRAWTRRGRECGERGERGRAGPASASGPEVRPWPASAPLSFFYFFEFLFSILVLNSFGLFKNPFHL